MKLIVNSKYWLIAMAIGLVAPFSWGLGSPIHVGHAIAVNVSLVKVETIPKTVSSVGSLAASKIVTIRYR